jgi:hypothetical protein
MFQRNRDYMTEDKEEKSEDSIMKSTEHCLKKGEEVRRMEI